jgi:hypothetical protein
VQTLWWEGGFAYGERVFYEVEASDRYLGELVESELARRGLPPVPTRRGPLRRIRDRLA